MKPGDLVYVFPGIGLDTTVGILLGLDAGDFSRTCPNEDVHPLHRSDVLFDGDSYSVPTFQLEVISENR